MNGRGSTGGPGRYLIPAERVSEGLLRALAVAAKPAAPVKASTVVVVRDGEGGPEALLLKRRAGGFAGGAWVFPGGTVDEEDRSVGARRPGAEARWARRLEVAEPGEAWALVVAAIRETWEETGLLVGEAPGWEDVLGQARAAVLGRADRFADAARAVGYRPRAAGMAYIARWITPVAEPRRYDTRFFMAAVEARATAHLAPDELVEARWLTPAAAIAAYEAEVLPMLPPTVDTLRRLQGFATARAMLVALRRQRAPSFLPRMRPHPEGVMIEIEELIRE